MTNNKYYKILQEMMLLMKHNNARKKEIMTAQELCEYLGFSKSYLYKLTSQRQIPHYKPLNKTIFFKRSEIDKWILSCPIQTRDKMLEKALMPLQVKLSKSQTKGFNEKK